VIERFMESPRRRTALQIGADGAARVLSIVVDTLLRYESDLSPALRPPARPGTRSTWLSSSTASVVIRGS
jgi:hypothetical protein